MIIDYWLTIIDHDPMISLEFLVRKLNFFILYLQVIGPSHPSLKSLFHEVEVKFCILGRMNVFIGINLIIVVNYFVVGLFCWCCTCSWRLIFTILF